MNIVFAERKDVDDILNFIEQLAEYEHMLDQVVADRELLEEWIFDKKKSKAADISMVFQFQA